MNQGTLIAIEGIDGSGKGTQARLLLDALTQRGSRAELFSFPAYDKTLAGALIGQYLNGGMGQASDIDSRLTALLFALDRFERKEALQRAISESPFVLCDRYVGSNLAHQVARTPPKRRADVRAMIDRLEHGVFGLPRPQVVIYLDMPRALAQERVRQKGARGYTKKVLDAHESDQAHLVAALREYRQQALGNPTWAVIPTVGKGRKPLDRETIHKAIMADLMTRGIVEK